MHTKGEFSFMARRKDFWLLSVVVVALGLIANILMGVRSDIRITGGTVLRYSYPESGMVSAADVPVSVVPDEDGHVMLLNSSRIVLRCASSCQMHDRVIFNLLRLVSSKNLMLHQKIDVTSKRTTREKLMAYLSWQAEKCGSRSFDIPFDRQALADYLEVDRSGLSSEIGKLRREGVLECEKNSFRLL